MEYARMYPGIETCEGNKETGRCGSEVCFSLLFRHAGPIGPLAPSGDGICGSEGSGGEAKAAAKKPACHASRDGIPVFVLDHSDEIPVILDQITHAQDGKGGEAQ
jgi:hypothetical protein